MSRPIMVPPIADSWPPAISGLMNRSPYRGSSGNTIAKPSRSMNTTRNTMNMAFRGVVPPGEAGGSSVWMDGSDMLGLSRWFGAGRGALQVLYRRCATLTSAAPDAATGTLCRDPLRGRCPGPTTLLDPLGEVVHP